MGDGMQREAERPAALPGDPSKLTINGVAIDGADWEIFTAKVMLTVKFKGAADP
jgi:hypothetical protein